MRTLEATLFACLLAYPLAAQPAPDDLAALRERLAQQQRQIEELRGALAEQRKLLDALASVPAAPAAPAQPVLAGDGKPVAPLSFRIGGADFTPGGFLDFTSVFRSNNVGSGIGTSFGNSPSLQLSESRFSAQNSRLTLRVNSKPGKQSVTGYVEADFLGALPANAHVTSNSGGARMRLYWVQVMRGKWEVLGGQSWSMLTPNRIGISPVPGDLFYTQVIDTNYHVGLTWTRAPQFRVVYHASKSWTAGLALENPQQYTGASVVLPSFYTSQFDNGSNTGTPNLHPDVIGKVAYDGRAGGRAVHVEAAGLFRSFRALGPAGGTSEARGIGGSLNLNLELVKNLRFILNSFYSQGGGRYIGGLGPDLFVRPDGSVSPVHSGAGIAGLEYQPDPKSLWYAYYGGAYFTRFPGSSSAANREIQEGTVGYARTFWKNPNYGALQLMLQYSYVARSPWPVPPGTPLHAQTHMVFTNLRYVLP